MISDPFRRWSIGTDIAFWPDDEHGSAGLLAGRLGSEHWMAARIGAKGGKTRIGGARGGRSKRLA